MSATYHPAAARSYAYVGPAHILEAVREAPAGAPIRCRGDLLAWLHTARHHDDDSPGWATYVVDLGGTLRLAHRRTEHVACAGGESVLAAGEVEFALDGEDGEVQFLSNNSSGYCPDVACLPAVLRALRVAGAVAPEGFTVSVPFRRCDACGERCTVKDSFYFCDLCEAPLSPEWNFQQP
ncbi:MAG: hypothetical protein IPG17_10425 [Sandaracinaceae bacterium]|nr:hypothetical protein [Sandaracinaceae bacterium]